jgi:hypothetical protein
VSALHRAYLDRALAARGPRAKPRKPGVNLTPDAPAPKRDNNRRLAVQIAKAVGCSVSGMATMTVVLRAAPELHDAIWSGAIKTVADAKRISLLPEEQRAEVLQRVAGGETVKAALLALRVVCPPPHGADLERRVAEAVARVRVTWAELRAARAKELEVHFRGALFEVLFPDEGGAP